MDHPRGKALKFLTRLAYGLGRKQRPAIIPLSKSLGSPVPQTSPSTSFLIEETFIVNPSHSDFTVFKLPDELILLVLSYISPDPPLTGHYVRFRVQYRMEINEDHERRVELLVSLSMTCRAMRLRFLPWIWEHIECFKLVSTHGSEGSPRGLDSMMRALHVDTFLAASVKYFRALL